MNKENLLTEISKMSEDERENLAYSTSDVEILNVLANDESEFVRKAVAENKNAPTETLALLAKDEKGYVRWAVAKNINTPVDVLEKLAKDKNKMVSEVAEEALKDRKEKSKANIER